MALVTGYVNLYHAGYYHRRGKPGGLDLHAGDIYTTEAEAKASAVPEAGYVCTGVVTYDDKDCNMRVNPADSVPVPISVTRKQIENGTADWLA